MIRTVRRRRLSQTEPLEARALLTPITVTTLADTIADDGETSLREAMTNANGIDIVFASGLDGTIALQLGALPFADRISITGNGADKTVIDAQGNSDIFGRWNGALSLQHLTLKNSAGTGITLNGAEDRLTIRDCVITGNAAEGVLASNDFEEYRSYLTIENSVISNNGRRGLRLFGGMSTTLTDSEVSGNGGGITADGGHQIGWPSLGVRRSTISNNIVPSDESGGGIYQGEGSLSVSDSVITGNQAGAGGGISHPDRYYSNFSMTRSTISGNVAATNGGGILTASTREMHNLTIVGNTAAKGAGVFSTSDISLTNSTITGNAASERGGGVFLQNGLQLFESNIVAENTAQTRGPDLHISAAQGNSFRNNFVGSNDGTDLTTTGLTADSRGNFVGRNADRLDPKLAALSNAGILSIRRPLSDSPVIGTGSNPNDLETDQPGLARNTNGVDIGSVEFVASSDHFQLKGSRLTVDGTAGRDQIELTEDGQNIRVSVNDEMGIFGLSDVTEVRVVAHSGADSITVSLPSVPATVLGGNGNDTIQGGSGREWILGGGGNDTLIGGGSRDILSGGNGKDSLIGGAGDDVVRGGDGEDTLKGGVGNDILEGDNDADLIDGNDGNDKLRGHGGNDTLVGSAGEDSVFGGGGHDLLNGGAGDDVLAGMNGADRINAGAGNDHTNGGRGHDTVTGGAGRDTLFGREGNDVLLGGLGNDLINGWTDRDILYGGEGQDTLQGRAGDDILIAGAITPPSGSSVRNLLIGSIRDEWLSERPAETRAMNILDRIGKTNDRANTDFLIGVGRTGQNVFDDSATDTLVGGTTPGDLFFARLGADVLDNSDDETIEGL